MPQTTNLLMNQPDVKDREFLLTEKDFKFLAKLVHEKTGIVLAEHKRNMVYSRLSRRLRQLNLSSFKEYCEFLQSRSAGDEILQLVNAITTNLTSFFREPHHFQHLEREVLTPFFNNPQNTKLRIWSAGCSQGCEPYSIAMVLQPFLEKNKQVNAKILATDIDTNMLNRGSSGQYRDEDYNAIPERYRRYVKPLKRDGEEGIIMAPALRKLISFNQLNLLDNPWPMRGAFDIIFCRNVVIYFDKETQKTLFNRYASAMKDNGWLFIGHSESLFKVTDRFKLHGKTIYRKVS